MDATCAVCGTTFPARSAKARYCSDRCRKRKDKAAEVVELTASAQPDEPTDRLGPVTLMTIKELQEAGRFETALGQACIALAHRMDRPGLDTGSALAAVAARLRRLSLLLRHQVAVASAMACKHTWFKTTRPAKSCGTL